MLADDFWCLVRDFLGPSRLIASSFRGLQYVGTLALRFVVWQQERVQRVCHNHSLASSHINTHKHTQTHTNTQTHTHTHTHPDTDTHTPTHTDLHICALI
jgi:hypothetical protein